MYRPWTVAATVGLVGMSLVWEWVNPSATSRPIGIEALATLAFVVVLVCFWLGYRWAFIVMLLVAIVGIVGNAIHLFSSLSLTVGDWTRAILFFWSPLALLVHPATRRYFRPNNPVAESAPGDA